MKSGTMTSSAKSESRLADDLDSAKSRIQELTSFCPGEFQVLDHDNHQIVAATDMNRRQPRQVVSETRPEIERAVRERESP